MIGKPTKCEIDARLTALRDSFDATLAPQSQSGSSHVCDPAPTHDPLNLGRLRRAGARNLPGHPGRHCGREWGRSLRPEWPNSLREEAW
jgi:hypothetical protein